MAAATESDRDGGPMPPAYQERDFWSRLAAPLNPDDVEWRQQGKPTERDGVYTARFVCYVEAGVVRERLDAVAPGQWSLELTVLPDPEICDANGEMDRDQVCAFKARLTVAGVQREDVGVGKDYKQASTDAFKRASVRFGIGHELYAMEGVWVKVDGGGKYAKPLEDPAEVYQRRHPNDQRAPRKPSRRIDEGAPSVEDRNREAGVSAGPPPSKCPKCGSPMYDNRRPGMAAEAPGAFRCKNIRTCGDRFSILEILGPEQTDALAGQGSAVPSQGGVSTTRTVPARSNAVKGPPPDNGKRLPGETDADVANQPRVAPPPRSTPPSQVARAMTQADFPVALQDDDDDLPF